MIDSVNTTTIRVAQQSDLGVSRWILLCAAMVFIAIAVCILAGIKGSLGISVVACVVAIFAAWAGMFLVIIQDDRSTSGLINRQTTALEEQLNYSRVLVTDEGDFVAADVEGSYISGQLVEKDDTVYYVIVDNQN